MKDDPYSREFIVQSEPVTGILTITANVQYNNVNAETVVVEEGVRTRIYGTITKEIIIRKDSKVFIHGKINGKITNEGGRIYHFE